MDMMPFQSNIHHTLTYISLSPYYTPQYNPLYNNGYGYPGYDPYSAFGHSPYKSKKHKSSSKYKKYNPHPNRLF